MSQFFKLSCEFKLNRFEQYDENERFLCTSIKFMLKLCYFQISNVKQNISLTSLSCAGVDLRSKTKHKATSNNNKGHNNNIHNNNNNNNKMNKLGQRQSKSSFSSAYLVQQVFRSKKLLSPKRILLQKNFGSKILWIQKF